MNFSSAHGANAKPFSRRGEHRPLKFNSSERCHMRVAHAYRSGMLHAFGKLGRGGKHGGRYACSCLYRCRSAAATALFWPAEFIMLRRGHKSGGYSLAHALFAAGNALLIFSSGSAGNIGLQWTLAGLAATLAVGALRHPAEKLTAIGGRHNFKLTQPLEKSGQLDSAGGRFGLPWFTRTWSCERHHR